MDLAGACKCFTWHIRHVFVYRRGHIMLHKGSPICQKEHYRGTMGLVQIFPVPILLSKKRHDLPRELIIQTSRKKTRKRKYYGGSSSAVWRGKSAWTQGFSDASFNKNEHSGIPHQSDCPAPSVWLKQHNLRVFVCSWIKSVCNEKEKRNLFWPFTPQLTSDFYVSRFGEERYGQLLASSCNCWAKFLAYEACVITWMFCLPLLHISALR